MNSGLQCLSNTAPLCDFMVSGRCDAEINRTNPLGTKGELTTEFSELLQDIWSGRMSSVAPRDFKWKLERFAPQFSVRLRIFFFFFFFFFFLECF